MQAWFSTTEQVYSSDSTNAPIVLVSALAESQPAEVLHQMKNEELPKVLMLFLS